ncbi:hypothetical protein HCG49_11990 [Arenibacter sp. 6A1]|uniref:SatD family protein n=1 Tax=Arenibacter sp. 6A1 TaxID=2720391 RepID=UPI001446B016|nr:SatD family protein [Arenibacter sp. 6A1]NKI27285.1 hypothetical protein [Arenibacter sp. 6A1]
MKVIAILTGDIVNSEQSEVIQWMTMLKKRLNQLGTTPIDWEIYRGDEFQIRTSPEDALIIAIGIKALIKTVKNLDVRIGIGIGEENFEGSSVSQSNGKAHQRSGRVFETLKKQKLNLAIATGDLKKDKALNLVLRLALDFMDNWSVVTAEVVRLALEQPDVSQQEWADYLKVQQSAVSQRLKRARMELVLEVLDFYKETVKEFNA